MKPITKEEWSAIVAKNAGDSYSLVVCLATLILWEAGAKTEEEAGEALRRWCPGLSGFQATTAIKTVLENDAEDWLDETGKKVRRSGNGDT